MKQEIIALKSLSLNVQEVRRIVGEKTGDFKCFFCPANVIEGQPFDGHVHVFPPHGAINVINRLIDMDQLT